MAVLFHDRAAARCIGDDKLCPGTLERSDVCPCQRTRAFQITSVRVQGAAALLSAGRHRCVSIHAEYALGCAIGRFEQSIHHAAAQNRDRSTLATRDWIVGRPLDRAAGRREHRHRKSQPTFDAGQQGGDRSRSKRSREEHCRTQQPLAGENKENQSRDERHRLIVLQRRACGLQQLSIRNAARAYGLTRSAAKALIDVLLHLGIRWRDGALEHGPHQEDASAWTIVLVFEIQICRACLEAEAAMHTRVDPRQRCGERCAGQSTDRHRVRRKRISRRWNNSQRAQFRSPRMPGFRMLCGSYARLMPCERESLTTLGETAAHNSGGSFSNTSSLESPWTTPAASSEGDSAFPVEPATTRITPRRGSIDV